MKFHHYGLIVSDIDTSIDRFKSFNYEMVIKDKDELQQAELSILENKHSRIELVCPFADNESLNKLLRNKSDNGYHLCFEVQDIDLTCKELKKNKIVLYEFSKPKPAKIFQQRRVAFYYINGMGLIEFLESGI